MPQRGRLNSDDEKRIRKNIILLKDNIDGDHFADKFFQEEIIEFDEKLHIGDPQATRLVRADRFINRLLHSGPHKAYSCFIDILQEKYPHVAENLKKTKINSSDPNYSWFLNSSNFSEVMKNHKLTSADICKVSHCFFDDWQIIFFKLRFTSCEIEQEYIRSQQDRRAQICNLMKTKAPTMGEFFEALQIVENEKLAIFDWETLEKFVKELRL